MSSPPGATSDNLTLVLLFIGIYLALPTASQQRGEKVKQKVEPVALSRNGRRGAEEVTS